MWNIKMLRVPFERHQRLILIMIVQISVSISDRNHLLSCVPIFLLMKNKLVFTTLNSLLLVISWARSALFMGMDKAAMITLEWLNSLLSVGMLCISLIYVDLDIQEDPELMNLFIMSSMTLKHS